MKVLNVEQLDNNYRVRITVNRLRKSFNTGRVLNLQIPGEDNLLIVKVLSCDLKSKSIECKKFKPAIYAWTTFTYSNSDIYKVGLVNWQTVGSRLKQTYTTGVLEPIILKEEFELDIHDPKITGKIEDEIHETITLLTKGREAVKGDWEKVIRPTIIKTIEKYKGKKVTEFSVPTPWYFQKDASDIASEYYKKNDKGWIQWTCGSGKSFGGYWIYKSIIKSCGLLNNIVVLLVPSKQLVSQTGDAWTYIAKAYGDDIRCLKVFSDEEGDVTTFLKSPSNKCINLIVSTYQSSHKISHSLKLLNLKADLVINDEVHRLTGEDGKSWSKCLFDTFIPSRKRLSMTASPIEYTSRSLGFSGLENENLYGKRFHQYNFLDAQLDGYTSPLEIMGVELNGIDWIKKALSEKKDIIQKNLYGEIDMSYLEEQVVIDKGNPAFFIQLHATLSGLRDGEFTHPIIYANSTKRIKMFMACLMAMAPLYNVNIDYNDIFTSKDKIEKRISELENKFSKAKIGVVGNVYCLQEGISINEVDAVVMIDPRSSAPAIIQILGRPVRLDINNKSKIAKVLLPIMIQKNSLGEVIIDSSYFNDMKDWIINLCASDEDMSKIITNMKILSDKSRQGIEVREVLPISSKSTISGINKSLDKKETLYNVVDFNDVIYNMNIESIISTKKSTESILKTKEGLDLKNNHKANDYINFYKTKLEVYVDKFSKNSKKHKDVLKDEICHIKDFAQLIGVSDEKSKDLLNFYGLSEVSSLTKQLQNKIILISLSI